MTREENTRTKAMLLTIAMTLAGFTISSPAVAIDDSLEWSSGTNLGLPDLGGLHPSMGSTPIPGLTIEKTGVAQNESVTLVDPGEVPDPLGALWTVRVGEDVFVTIVAMEGQPRVIWLRAFPEKIEGCSPIGDLVDPEDRCVWIDNDEVGVCLDDENFCFVRPNGWTIDIPPCLLFDVLDIPCEPVLHIADIADPIDIAPEFPPTGFRLCVYEAYVGLDVIPPEGDDFGGNEFLLPEVVEDTKC